MCLNRPIPLNKIKNRGIGWKIFKKENGRLMGAYQHGHSYPVREEFKDESKTQLEYEYWLSPPTYQTGFHIFDDEKEAIRLLKYKNEYQNRYVLYRIKYSNVVAYGSQDLGDSFQTVVVARKMKLLRKVKVD